MSNPYEVLLYYKYARLDDPDAFAADHRLLCQRLGLRGRIVVATEGLNGTVSGTKGLLQRPSDMLHVCLEGFI